MTSTDLELARDLGRATRTYIDQRLETVTAPLVQRIQELERARLADEARIKMLEARPTLEYKGCGIRMRATAKARQSRTAVPCGFARPRVMALNLAPTGAGN